VDPGASLQLVGSALDNWPLRTNLFALLAMPMTMLLVMQTV